ncbi:MAG TPA: hypothetical protein VFO70_07430 [Chitinophagaceae bacterium]|nr:hypothetical protein [Chitinophagaceae bacterium]
MYTYTWKKYLPVIRLLMKKSVVSDQVVTLNRIDFEKGSRARKPACSFSVEIKNARLVGLNQPTPAKDLLDILVEDETAKALLRQYHYAISLASDFRLTIKNLTPPVLAELESESAPNGD